MLSCNGRSHFWIVHFWCYLYTFSYFLTVLICFFLKSQYFRRGWVLMTCELFISVLLFFKDACLIVLFYWKLRYIYLKKVLHFLTLNNFNAHKIQAISYDKLLICWKSFVKALPSQKKWAFICEHFIGELCSQVTFNKFVFFICIYVCYGITTKSIWPGILRRERWKYFTCKIEHYS